VRFVLLIVGCVAVGAMSAGVIQTVYPQAAETVAAVRAMGSGLGSGLSDFRLADLTPIGWAYRYVMHQVTSGESRVVLHHEPLPTFKPVALDQYRIDPREIQRSIDAGFSRQVQDNIRRTQDMSAWMRSPPAFHGPPPH
jgi:hypothetical protein